MTTEPRPDRTGIARDAKAIGAHGGAIAKLFPAGSAGHMSAASPRIWEDLADVTAKSREMVDAADRLATAADWHYPTALQPRFRALGATCSGCHRDYRMKKH